MASIGHGIYVVVVLTVGGSKTSCIKLVSQREPITGKTRLHVGSNLPNEELVDGAVRELREETGLALIYHDIPLLSNNPVRVFSAYAPVPFAEANIRTLAKLVQ
jgi:8-oxo-dGTP pyrophosphatase MutT (NUDIX family)